MGPPPTPELLDWVARTVGTPRVVAPCGWPQGPSRVWRVVGSDRGLFYLKQFSEENKRDQEIAAYECFVPALRGGAVLLPELVARSGPTLRSLLFSALEGTVVSRSPLAEEEGIRLHRIAGEFIRRMHDLPFEDDDTLPLSQSIPLRLALWLERGGDRLSGSEGDLARRLVGDGSLFAGDRRVPCHRDFQTRNWIFDQNHPDRLGVIDFEHTRADHPLIDWVRVHERALPRYPRWFEAFTQGYGAAENGRALDDGIALRLRALSAVHAVGSVVWGSAHRDAEFERAGHELLAQLRS